MSEENVESARRAYAAFNQGGVDAILEYLDPEIEWRMWERFSRDARVFNGHSGVREVLSVFEENFDEFGAKPHEFIVKGDCVVVPVELHGQAKGTGEPTSFELVHVWKMVDERASRLDVYDSIEAALTSLESG